MSVNFEVIGVIDPDNILNATHNQLQEYLNYSRIVGAHGKGEVQHILNMFAGHFGYKIPLRNGKRSEDKFTVQRLGNASSWIVMFNRLSVQKEDWRFSKCYIIIEVYETV